MDDAGSSSATGCRMVLILPLILVCAGDARVVRAQTHTPEDRYAESFLELKPEVRDYEQNAANRYTYCIRSIAVYECLSYGSDGSVRRQRTQAAAHGTGFAYQELNGESYLLTNEHVADWPPVTDEGHPVEGVAAGCKRVSDTLKIVESEHDTFIGDDIPLTRVVVDEALDAAVVKTKAHLRKLPYRVGRSTDLQTGDAVYVRGFPLGAFQAVNTGKVVNPHDFDVEKDWEHDDFIIDAPLSVGNSGSPVLAVNNATGEYELVGIYHASYTESNALNAVIGIDQLQTLMTRLERAPRGEPLVDHRANSVLRAELIESMRKPTFVPFVALGSSPVRISASGDLLIYELFSKRFPLDDHRVMLIADRPAPDTFGVMTRLWFGNERGLKAYDPATLDAETRGQLRTLSRRLHSLALSTVKYRAAASTVSADADEEADRVRIARAIERESVRDSDLVQLVAELSERFSPHASENAVSAGDVLSRGLPVGHPSGPVGRLEPAGRRNATAEITGAVTGEPVQHADIPAPTQAGKGAGPQGEPVCTQ